ncbi:CoA-binding protein, partial [Candidatus Bathyarchaeota archaeon]|nr:CoA-binding protein [Candidatus Bathyarchaeota archaeon]
MVKLIDKNTRAIVQGITGTQGRFHTWLMLDYGTKVVAGVTPGRGGQEVEGVPVYDTVAEAMRSHDVDASIIYVPAPAALDAALEAIEAELNPVVVITEGIPVRDSIELVSKARQKDITVVGPNTPGLIKAGESKLGIMPAQVFKKGRIGVISRSGTLFYEIAAHVTRAGLGESSCVGLGGDPVVGLDYIEMLEW